MQNMMKNIIICLFIVFNFQQILHAATTANIITGGPQITGDFSDPGITTAINNAVSESSSVSNLNISISVYNRVVSLTGTVNNASEAANMVAVVESVPGVINTDTSQLTLTGGKPLPFNLILTAKVKGSLVREQAFGKIKVEQLPITVETNNGIVYLKGTVNSQAQLFYVIKVVQAVPGVPRVISELTVKLINLRTT